MTTKRLGTTRPTRPTDEHRAALGRAVGLGAVLLPMFGVLDVFTQRMIYPSASLSLVFALRAVASSSAVLSWWVTRDMRFSDRAAAISHVLCLATVAAAVAGIANEFGGPTSVYMQGLSIIVMVRSATVPAQVKESLVHGLLIALVYVLVFAGLYAAAPAEHAHWLSRTELASFTVQYLMVGAAIGCGCLASHASWAAQRQLYQARKLGRYRLEVPIGKGGQNEVWLAWDSTLKRNVALKILRASTASDQAVLLFEREALLASQLECPHTVRIYDFGASDDGIYYLAMEHLVGADLGALSKAHGPLPPARVVWFGIQACRSLEEAHDKGLVHRDIKPSNLFAISVDERHDVLKLLDFGVACSFRDQDEVLTRTGTLRGTPAYLAPECCRGEPVTPAVDLYGLGATLYQLLTGSPPFTGEETELIAKHLAERPEPPSARLGRAISEDLERIVMRCLEKGPEARFPSARALRSALEACRDARAWSAEDAARFWTGERVSMLTRWEADTLA